MPEHVRLAERIDEFGLGEARDFLLASAVPCYLILRGDAASGAPLGATRFGGAPDLPEGTAWPRGSDGRLANFFAQLDFADLAVRIDAPELPREGLLSLVATSIETGLELIGVTALMTLPGTPLMCAEAPESSLLVAPERAAPAPIHVRFARYLSLPRHSRAFRRALAPKVRDDEAFAAFIDEFLLRQNDEIGRLLGFAADPLYGSAHDYYRRLYFHSIGRAGFEWQDYWESQEEYDAYLVRCHEASAAQYRRRMKPEVLRWLFEHRAEVDAGAATWLLLLTVESNRAMDFNINDSGAIYFFLPAADLAKGDFSRATADQFG
ncbi:MAG TPA: DUF1963 domain-containing protein [Stellaceae bacterium]|nr:DUF1963 domain-containing protein [Stellaceae bacterium]